MAVGRLVAGPESAFLLPSECVQTHRTFVLLPSTAAAADSISQLAPRRARQFRPNERAIRSASLASRPKSSINLLLLAGEFGRGCRKLGQLNSLYECSPRTTSRLEAIGKARQQAVAYSSQLVSHSSQFRSNRGFSGEVERRHEHLSTSGIPFERRGERAGV